VFFFWAVVGRSEKKMQSAQAKGGGAYVSVVRQVLVVNV
jgi:hypothetical protein